MRSPFIAIAEYEQELGLPKDYINVSMFVPHVTVPQRSIDLPVYD